MGRRNRKGEFCITRIRIPVECSEKIKEISQKCDITVSEYITRLIQMDIAINWDDDFDLNRTDCKTEDWEKYFEGFDET